MRSAHHSHRIGDVAPLAGFFGFALVLARHRFLCGLRDRSETVRFEHLPSDRMYLNFGHHALCSYCMELGINHRAGDEFHYVRCVTLVTANAVPKGNTAARNLPYVVNPNFARRAALLLLIRFGDGGQRS
jgi:hypothetical protein